MNYDLRIDNGINLTKSSYGDKEALIAFLNDEEIYNQTLRIPSPYTEKDALATVEYNLNFEEKNNKRRNWAIRNNTNELMGHIGLHYPYGLDSDKNEVYYWLGKPFRNKGIMTKVLAGFTEYCFTQLNYKRLEAPIFDFNIASEKLLIHSGYIFENELPNHYKKGEQIISAKMYVKENK